MYKFFILFFCGLIYAQEPYVELCVKFGNECYENCADTYAVHIKGVKASKEQPLWILKDSVSCDCGVWTSPTYTLRNLPGKSYPFFSMTSCSWINKKKEIGAIPEPPKVRLDSSIVGKQVFYAIDLKSKKDVEAYFGKSIELLWKTNFVCQGNSSNDTTLTYKIDALLVGECPDSLTSH